MTDRDMPPGDGRTQVRLRSGTLRLAVERADWPLESLCGFASRRGKKRGFVFVSKVLGKHYPVRPRVMEEAHARLVAQVETLREAGNMLRQHVSYVRFKAYLNELNVKPESFDAALEAWNTALLAGEGKAQGE